MNREQELRVLICAPTGRDAALARATLTRAGILAEEVGCGPALGAAVREGAGCVLVTHEALSGGAMQGLIDALAAQPPWSDLPVLVLTAPTILTDSPRMPPELLTQANVTIFERPVAMETLLAGVRAGLRARQRQYAARAVLHQVQLQADELGKAAAERLRLLEAEQRARLAAEEATRAKDEFLAVVSHELRTPLSAILGWTALLRGGRLQPERAAHGIDVIHRNASAQARVIEDLLDVSKIITGKLKLDVELVDAEQVVAAAVETVRLAAEGRGVKLNVAVEGAPRPVRGDPARLQQVIWNLLHNAIKFNHAGGQVTVTVASDARQLEIRIVDDGRGIAPAFLPFVFDRFRQAETPTTRSTGGLGLGLAICRHVVELHGGTIEVRSEGLDRGATFTVRLPLSGPAASAQPRSAVAHGVSIAESEPSRAELKGLTILIVDDDADTREFVRTAIERCEAEVVEAGSATEALALVEARPPSILISDIGMAGEDGLSLMRRVRALPGPEASLPAIALSAFARDEDRAASLSAGFQLHLPKPVQFGALVAAISRLTRAEPKSSLG